jgi:hypothetical protein
MLPVVSIRNVMSGFGGIAGVDTVLAIVVDPPGDKFNVTSAGVTPGAADALPIPLTSTVPMATTHRAALNLRVIRTFLSPSGRAFCHAEISSLATQTFLLCAAIDVPPINLQARADAPHSIDGWILG